MRIIIWSGSLLILLWTALAVWSQHSSQLPVGGLLAILAGAWITLLIVWKGLKVQDNSQWKLWILIFAIAMRIPSFFATPLYEDDYFRFLWDGWNFATQGSPYVGAPEESFGHEEQMPAKMVSILQRVNYPEVPTIYPPACQFFFLIAALIEPGSLFALRLVLLIVEIGVLLLFSRVASAKLLVLLAWCPLLIFESTFQVHPDVLGMAMLFAAYFFRLKKQNALTGVFAGLALCIKITTLPALPFLLWPLRRNGALAFFLVVLGSYLPFLLQGSRADFDGLAVFTREWEFNAGLYALAIIPLSDATAKVVMLTLFASAFLYLWFTWARSGALLAAVPQRITVVYGLFFLISPVVNPWYLVWLIPFVSLRPQAWSLAALALVSVSYVRGQTLPESWDLSDFAQPVWLQTAEYAIVLVLGMLALRTKKPAEIDGLDSSKK